MDAAVSIRSGATMGETWRQHYEGYEGLLHVLKLPRLNSLLTPPPPLSSTYLIKVHRRRLALDPLHTPPEPGTPLRARRACIAAAADCAGRQRAAPAGRRPARRASSSDRRRTHEGRRRPNTGACRRRGRWAVCASERRPEDGTDVHRQTISSQ